MSDDVPAGGVDFHCHLDLYPDFETAIAKAEAARIYTLTVTTTPKAWPRNHVLTRGTRYVRAALGLHPQLVAERAGELALWEHHLPEARYVGEVGDITGKLTMCLHDRYFDPFGGPAAWIESVTAECREKLAPLFQLTLGERTFLDGVLDGGKIDASSLDVPEAVRAAIEASPALRWKAQNVKAWKSGDKPSTPRRRRARPRGTEASR
jgi:hypothetical protein